MFKSVKALLCILLLVGLFAVLIMCESDAHKIAKSKELIKQHAKIAAAQKNAVATNKKNYQMHGTGPFSTRLGRMSLLERHPGLTAKSELMTTLSSS